MTLALDRPPQCYHKYSIDFLCHLNPHRVKDPKPAVNKAINTLGLELSLDDG